MYSGSKSELLRCLEEDINTTDMIPSTDVAVIDGSLMVHLLKHRACKKNMQMTLFYPIYVLGLTLSYRYNLG